MKMWLVAAVALSAACDDKKTSVAPVASALAPSVVAPSAMSKKFTIDPAGRSTVDMPAPKERIKGDTSAAAGTLDVDFANLANSRGEVKVDLSTFSTHTFGDAQDQKQTLHARCWLEVADCEDGKLGDDVKAANRYAVFAIRTIDNASATNLASVAPTKDGAFDVRTVTLTAHGELLIHGHKVDRDAELEVAFRSASGEAATAPTSLRVSTKKPLRVVLAEHDVKPRDNLGKLVKGALTILGTKVAETADISFELQATPKL